MDEALYDIIRLTYGYHFGWWKRIFNYTRNLRFIVLRSVNYLEGADYQDTLERKGNKKDTSNKITDW